MQEDTAEGELNINKMMNLLVIEAGYQLKSLAKSGKTFREKHLGYRVCKSKKLQTVPNTIQYLY